MNPAAAGRTGDGRPAAGSGAGASAALRRAALASVAAAVLWTAAALVGALRYGYPDNGDFAKYSRHFIAGPAGEAAPIPRTEEEWRDAFSKRGWHRYWTLRSGPDAPAPDPGTGTTNLLWLPGRWLHAALRPGPLLDVVDLCWLPRLFLLVAVAGLAAAVALDACARRAPLLLLAVAPWPLALGDSAMTAYLNTFFRETGTFTFAALLVATLALAPRLARLPAALGVLLTGGLMVATAPVHGPLAAIVALAAWDVARPGAATRTLGPVRRALLLVAIAGVLAVGVWRTTTERDLLKGAAVFDSLFVGILPLSDAPAAHLERLGLPRTSLDLVGRSSADPQARAWRKVHGARIGYGDLLGMFRAEPRLVPRVALRAAGIMNRTAIRGRNMFAEDDPAPHGEAGWNAWGQLQRQWFPRGLAYLFYCPLAIAGGLAAARSRDGGRAAVGRLLAVTAALSVSSLLLNFLGDGPMAPARHYVAANFFLGASLGAALWLGLGLVARPRQG